MKQRDICVRLDDIAGDLDSFCDDFTINQAKKNLEKIKDKVESLSYKIEEEGIEQDKE